MRRVGRTLVMVQNDKTPTDNEWNEFLQIVDQDPHGLRLFVMTDGGAPSADQRKRLEGALRSAQPLVAAVSDSLKVRFVAATIALFHSTHGSFTKSEKQKAYDHLRLEKSERQQIDVAIEELKAHLLAGKPK
jgi:hypothetical protein